MQFFSCISESFCTIPDNHKCCETKYQCHNVYSDNTKLMIQCKWSCYTKIIAYLSAWLQNSSSILTTFAKWWSFKFIKKKTKKFYSSFCNNKFYFFFFCTVNKTINRSTMLVKNQRKIQFFLTGVLLLVYGFLIPSQLLFVQ